MIVVIEPHNCGSYPNLLEKMFRLRAHVFRDKMKWDVKVIDGMERDKYDDESPVYVVLTDQAEHHVYGSLRLLPTTGPTLLKDTFLDTLPDAVDLSSPTIWECTRLCIDERLMGDRLESLLPASTLLIEALGEVALKAGIETVLGVFEPIMLRIYRRIGCAVEILGCTRRFELPVYLGAFEVSEEILGGIRRRTQRCNSNRAETLAA